MTAASSRAFPSLESTPRRQAGTSGMTKSRVKVLEQSSVMARARQRALDLADAEGVLPLAAEDFRDWFVPAFARWLQANFESREHVARAFGVRHSTASNWWDARNCAGGDMAGIVFLTFPAAVSWFLAEWRGR